MTVSGVLLVLAVLVACFPTRGVGDRGDTVGSGGWVVFWLVGWLPLPPPTTGQQVCLFLQKFSNLSQNRISRLVRAVSSGGGEKKMESFDAPTHSAT